ncbi:MAG: hypothetical protein AAF557_23000 [Pseudomonadota bacterium]
MTYGVLAIWNDCAQGHEAAYEAWYMREHLPERLSLPGFRRVRRYGAVRPGPEFFTYYETDSAEVLATADYIERVEDPTPMTRQIMSGVFLNMNRTVCHVVGRVGYARGSFAAVLRMAEAPPDPNLKAVLAELNGQDGIARAEAWRAAENDVTADNAEAKLRGGDDQIGACLFIETLREKDADRALGLIAARHPGVPGIYRLLCEVTAEEMPA